MNCVNCNSRLFLFNETEELYPGSELVFCSSCRKRIAPFLEDPNRYPTHAEHLEAWKRDLTAVGVTPRGMQALSAYCAYLDRITPKRQEPRETVRDEQPVPSTRPAAQPPIAVVPVKEVAGKITELSDQVDSMRGKLSRMARTVRYALWAAIAAAATGLGSLIALAANLAGCA